EFFSVRWRPGIFPSPFARDVFQVWIGRVPMTQIDNQPRMLQNTCVTILEPVIPPADSLIAPLNLRTGMGIVRESMGPWTNEGLQRRFCLLEHVRNAVAITIQQATD